MERVVLSSPFTEVEAAVIKMEGFWTKVMLFPMRSDKSERQISTR
jgi:hypothetical protein